MYLFYLFIYSGRLILEDHTESSWFNNSGFDSGSQTNTPSPAHAVCLPHLSHLIQLISSLVQTARPRVLLNSYLCIILSFPRISAPPPQDARKGCTEKTRRGGTESSEIIYLAPFSVTSELTSCAKWIWPYIVKLCFLRHSKYIIKQDTLLRYMTCMVHLNCKGKIYIKIITTDEKPDDNLHVRQVCR